MNTFDSIVSAKSTAAREDAAEGYIRDNFFGKTLEMDNACIRDITRYAANVAPLVSENAFEVVVNGLIGAWFDGENDEWHAMRD